MYTRRFDSGTKRRRVVQLYQEQQDGFPEAFFMAVGFNKSDGEGALLPLQWTGVGAMGCQ